MNCRLWQAAEKKLSGPEGFFVSVKSRSISAIHGTA